MTEWYWTRCGNGWYYCDRDCTNCVNRKYVVTDRTEDKDVQTKL